MLYLYGTESHCKSNSHMVFLRSVANLSFLVTKKRPFCKSVEGKGMLCFLSSLGTVTLASVVVFLFFLGWWLLFFFNIGILFHAACRSAFLLPCIFTLKGFVHYSFQGNENELFHTSDGLLPPCHFLWDVATLMPLKFDKEQNRVLWTVVCAEPGLL